MKTKFFIVVISLLLCFVSVFSQPGQPVLQQPPNHSNGISVYPSFDWADVVGATTYNFQLALDSNFINIIINVQGLIQSQYQVTQPLGVACYYWRVQAHNSLGNGLWSAVWTFCTAPSGIKPISSDIPKEYKLYDNYPNPFNPATKIKFSLPLVSEGRGGLVTLKIFDLLGSEVATLVNENLKPGTYEIEWNADEYPSGAYFYQITMQSFQVTKRMVLIK